MSKAKMTKAQSAQGGGSMNGEPIEARINRLLRWHRQNIDFSAADCPHTRAIRRIKATPTYKRVNQTWEAEARHRASEKLLRTWA